MFSNIIRFSLKERKGGVGWGKESWICMSFPATTFIKAD